MKDTSGSRLQQRIRWWSALSLLRSLASSPAAAAATLQTRAASATADTAAGADVVGAAEVLDQAEDDALDSADATPGAIAGDATGSHERRVLNQLCARATQLIDTPQDDAKLSLLIKHVKALLGDGYQPIVFCRFIPTAHYVTTQLRTALKRVDVEVVTGELSSEERTTRVAALAERAGTGPRVLVATDCLSEGVNLQADFQAVVHYDLAWNPTRHEQREGRVDRFGQPFDIVRALLLYGEDTGIDGIVLEVLLRKHEAIRKDLGVSVPVPPQSDQVLAALLEGILLRGREHEQLAIDVSGHGEAQALDEQWRSSAEAERRSHSRYAHATIRPEEVKEAVDSARASLGSPDDVAAFVRIALDELGATLTGGGEAFSAALDGCPVGLRDAIGAQRETLRFVQDLPAPRGAAVLTRTDPTVTALARFVLDAALDSSLPGRSRPARRCGLIVTKAITTPTVALLVRLRTHLTLPGSAGANSHVAEEARVLAFTGSPQSPTWLPAGDVTKLLSSRPDANVPADVARSAIAAILAGLAAVEPHLEDVAHQVAEELRKAHTDVRQAARGERAGALTVRGLQVEAQLPVDVLGVYVYRPAGGPA